MAKQSRQGLSLPVVLGLMLLATIVGTSLHRALTKKGFTSGAQMQHDMSYTSAKAGLTATKAWFSFHAAETKVLFQKFLTAMDNAGGVAVPFEIDVQADIEEGSRQDFRVFLVDLTGMNEATEISAKVQVLGKGPDSSESVMTAVIALNGLVSTILYNYVPAQVPQYVGGEDAVYIQGLGSDVKTPVKAHGNLYLGGDGFIQGSLEVDQNLLVGRMDEKCHEVNGLLRVGGSAYIDGCLSTQGSNGIKVGNHLRVSGLRVNGTGVEIGTAPNGGDLYVDSIVGIQGGPIQVKQGSVPSRGNFYVSSKVRSSGYDIEVSGDIRIGPFVNEIDMDVGGTTPGKIRGTSLTSDVWVMAPINFETGTTAYGNPWANLEFKGEVGFYQPGHTAPLNLNTAMLAEGPGYNGINPEDTVHMANELSELIAQLDSATHKKPLPYVLSEDTVDKWAKNWAEYRDNFGTGCGIVNKNPMNADDWNCIYENVATNAPDLLNAGFLYVNLQGLQLNNLESIPASELVHNFVFEVVEGFNPLLLYSNSSNSRVIWWLRNKAGQVRVRGSGANPRIWGLIYVEGIFDTGGDGIDIHGQIVIGNGGSLNSNGGPLEVWFDTDVLNDLVANTGMFYGDDIDNDPTDALPTPYTLYSFNPLSPYLKVNVMAEYLDDDLTDTTNLQKPSPGFYFMPDIAVIQEGDDRTLQQIQQDAGVIKKYVGGGNSSLCAPTPTQAITPPWNTQGKHIIKYLSNCAGFPVDSSTSFTVIVQEPTDAKAGELVVSWLDASLVVQESSSGDQVYEVRLKVQGNNLATNSKITLTTGGTATRGAGYDYEILEPSTGEWDFPVGFTGDFVRSVKIKVFKDAVSDEPDETVTLTLGVASGAPDARVAEPQTAHLSIVDENYNLLNLVWTDDTSHAHCDVDVEPNLLPWKITDDHHWQVRTNADIRIIANPSQWYEVDTWGGACIGTTGKTCLISGMSADQHFSLTFKRKRFTVDFTVLPQTGGTITTVPVGTDNGDGSRTYDAGTVLVLTAVANTAANPEYRFRKWTGDTVATDPSLHLLLDENKRLTASFSRLQPRCFTDDFDEVGLLEYTPVDIKVSPFFHKKFKELVDDDGDSVLRSIDLHGWFPYDYDRAVALIRDIDVGTEGTLKISFKNLSSHYGHYEGTVFRYTDAKHFYYIGVKPSSGIYYCKNGFSRNDPSVCQLIPLTFSSSNDVDLKVEMSDSTFNIYIDDVLKKTLIDSDNPTGYVGLGSFGNVSDGDFNRISWEDANGCSVNEAPQITDCALANNNGVDTNSFVVGEVIHVKATLNDVDLPVGTPLSYDLTFSDDVGHTYSGTQSTGLFSQWIGNHQTVGTYTATLVVTDDQGSTDQCSLPFRIQPTNGDQLPIINLVQVNGRTWDFSSDSLDATVQATIYVEASDPDGDPLTWSWSAIHDPNVTLSPMTQSGGTSLTSYVTFAAAGTYGLTLSVDDGRGGQTDYTMSFLVKGGNHKPVITSCSATPSSGMAPLITTLDVVAADAETPTASLTYQWTIDGIVSSETGASFQKTFNFSGTYMVSVQAYDGSLYSSACDITVQAQSTSNQPPENVTCSVNGGNSATVDEGEAFTLNASANDPDGNDAALIYRWSLSWLSGTTNGNQQSMSIASSGSYTANLEVEDESGERTTCSNTLNIQVVHPNSPPTCTFSATGNEGDKPFSTTFSKGYTDGDIPADGITEYCEVTKDGSSYYLSGFDCSGLYSFTEPGLYQVLYKVKDEHDAYCTPVALTITVTENQAPVASCAGSSDTVGVGEEMTWSALNSSDPDNDLPLIYSWSGDASGTNATYTTSYNSSGVKTAILDVTDSHAGDPKSTQTSCSVLVRYPDIGEGEIVLTMDAGDQTTVVATQWPGKDAGWVANVVLVMNNAGQGLPSLTFDVTANGSTTTVSYTNDPNDPNDDWYSTVNIPDEGPYQITITAVTGGSFKIKLGNM